MMKFAFYLLLIVLPAYAQATNYYIDPSSTSKEERGSIIEPWKSFAPLHEIMSSIKPGDSILLKRGELFGESLDLKCSGSANALIVVTSYGDSKTKPVFIYRSGIDDTRSTRLFAVRVQSSKYVLIEGIEITDDHIDPNDHSIPANIKIAFAIQESDHIMVKNCEVSRVGIGINILGNNNRIDGCNIKNLRMVLNTQEKPYDDYGANGIVLSGAGNMITNCNFYGCWANSYDFEFDGGAIEMADSVCNRNQVVHNTAFDCNGFMEFGSNVGGTISNNIVKENLVFNCSDLLYINNDGPFKVNVRQLEISNNIFIQTYQQLTKPNSMISMRKNSAEKNIIVLRDNFFWLTTAIDVTRPAQFESGSLVHTGNMYYLKGGKLNFTAHPSEKMLDPASKELKTLSNKYQLHNVDLYPFILLARFWYLMI